MNSGDVLTMLPLVAIWAVAFLVILADVILPGRDRVASAIAVIGTVVAMAITVVVAPQAPQQAFGGAYVLDQLTVLLDLVFLSIAILTLLFAPDYLQPRGLPLAEFGATLLFAISGAMLLAGARDLLVLFLGLELLVLPGYLLAGFAKHDGLSTEGAIKYFLLGSFSSAIFLFGLAFVWGFTGTTSVSGVSTALQAVAAGHPLSPGLAMGLAFLMTGVAFKIAAVPFHYWTPDAYQGSPTPVTGYLSVGPKVAAFALILRLFVGALAPVRADWLGAVIILAALTMTLGNLVALTQSNVKRMLAYSSIAHTGYILVGLAAYAGAAAGSEAEAHGLQAILVYSVAYTFMNLGAFAVVAALQRRPGVNSNLDTFSGLGRRAPLMGLLMTLFLISLTGIPPTAGFFAKYYVILAAVEAGGWVSWLAVLAVLNAAAAAFYYLRVVVYMYMREAPDPAPPLARSVELRAGLTVAALATIMIGLFPSGLITIAAAAARVLL
ncbi:MAG: NADH-quinone oxidoreductase subunit N [Candidatus Limnocylindrales bacterium]